MLLPSRRGRAFTLVELLVVVAIISLLATLLLPVLEQAIESAHSLQCVNNLHQTSLLVGLYTDSYNVVLFNDWHTLNTFGSYVNYWGWYFVKEFGQEVKPMVSCSSYPTTPVRNYQKEYQIGWTYGWLYSLTDSYVINDTFWGGGGVADSHQWYSMDWNKMKSPANTGVMLDTIERPTATAYARTQTHLCRKGQRSGLPFPIHMRHLERANVLLADGHALSASADTILGLDSTVQTVGNSMQPTMITYDDTPNVEIPY